MYNNSYNRFKNTNKLPRSIEPVGIIPRSIIRTLNRFLTQLFQNSNRLVIEEFRISRYQILVSLQSLISLIFIPLIVNFLAKSFILIPLTDYLWNKQQDDIFLNLYLEKEALIELQDFEEILYFDYFLTPIRYEKTNWVQTDFNALEFPVILKSQIQKKTLDLASNYNKKSIKALTNLFGDLITFTTLILVIIVLKPQIIIFKSFLIEFIYSLSDTLKSALLILSTNLLVGFHSPRGWELFLEFFLNRFGFPPNENFIFLFVATFPVLLDTIFKYWIFRYLNKISPSTVATYHAMIE